MDLQDILTQTVFVFLKEGLSFVFSSIKDNKAAQKSEEKMKKAAEARAIEAVTNETTPLKSSINWNKVATLFWLGNDLMWIQDMTYRGAPPERILQGINHVIKYVEDLGFTPNSLPNQDLTMAKRIVESLIIDIPANEDQRNVLEKSYRDIQQYIQTVKWYINALANSEQPDFEKLRAL